MTTSHPRGRTLPLARTLFAILLLAIGAAPAAAIQKVPTAPEDTLERSRVTGAIAVLNTQPLGTLATGPGLGLAVSGAYALDRGRLFRIRGELRAAGYGSETRRACLSQTVSCLIEVDVVTEYTNFYVGVGPELAIPILGSELALAATIGGGSFQVTSSIKNVSGSEDEDLLTTENFSDNFLAWSVGGELRVALGRQASLMVGTHYQHNGDASYVPEGGVTSNPDGSITIDALTGDANLVAITLGVAFRPFVGAWDEIQEGDPDGF